MIDKNNILRAFGNIDDRYICETSKPYNEKTVNKKVLNYKVGGINDMRVNPIKVTSIAAIAILIVLTVAVFINKQNNVMPIEELVQITNPITEVNSLSEMRKYLGYDVPTLEKEVETYIVIGYDNYANHARIMYKDETRFDMEKGTDDVSGIYGGTLEKEENIDNINVQYYTYEDISYVIWNNKGYSYSYSVSNKEINKEELIRLIKLTK